MGEKAAALAQKDMARTDRAREEYRQYSIDQGLTALGRVFDGGGYGTGSIDPTELVPGQTYYTATGEAFTVPFTVDGRVLAQDPAAPTKRPSTVNMIRDAMSGKQTILPSNTPKPLGDIYSGVGSLNPTRNYAVYETAMDLPLLFRNRAQTEGFTDDFFNKRRDAYLNYATPQLQDQYGDAQGQVTFALSRAGTGTSTTANQRFGRLKKDYGLRQQEVADTAQNQASSARGDVAAARGRAEDVLMSTGNADAAVRSALETANNLRSSAPSFSPLGTLFANASAGLAGYADNARYGAMEKRLDDEYGSIPSASGSGSGRIVK